MESANLLDSSLYCCHRCKGLFSASDDKVKHQINCMGNPTESSCAYFACERKIFLQLFQPDDFLLDGCDPPFLFSKDDSFINHFVKIRVPDIFDPSIFLKSASTLQHNQGDPEDANFLIESNINTLGGEAEKATGSTYTDPIKEVDQISEDRIQSIINKNIEYLKHDDIPSLSSGRNKVESSFSSSQSFPQLLSPIDKHLHLFGEGYKSRLHSPFERGSGLLHDGQLGYGSGSFMYSSNPSLPFSCGLSTDLFSSIPAPQEENQQTLPTNIEEFPTLQYLDLAKKDPVFGQNLGLSQINNTKDPFLINAAIKTTERQSFGLQKSHITRSCEDVQSSPALPPQDGNYFNFPSTLDEPTQLDYLDLATLDFITNPNLINYAPVNIREKPYEKDEDIFSEDNITCHEPKSAKAEAVTRLGNSSLSDHGGSEGLSAFSRVKKKKKLRLKKSKSDIERRYENISSPNRSYKNQIHQDIKDVFVKHQDIVADRTEDIHAGKSLFENADIRKCRKRRSYSPKGNKSESKLMKMNRKCNDFKPDKHLNVREKLTHLTEEQKDKMKAVLGQSGCIFVKKKRSLSCDEPVVYVNDSQLFGGTGFLREHSIERDDKFHPIKSNSRVLFDEQYKTRKLTSVLHLKCQECEFKCRSVIELKNHRAKHLKKTKEALFENKNKQPNKVLGIQKQLTDQQKMTEKDAEVMEQGMVYHLNTSYHLEKIPEGAVLDEQAGSQLYNPDISNTFTTSLSVPSISENSEPNFCESIDNSDAINGLNVSSTNPVSFLPVKMTEMPMNHTPESGKSSIPLLNQSTSSLNLTADISQETEMAVKALENISSEIDKCCSEEVESSSAFSCNTSLMNLDKKNKAEYVLRSDIDAEKSGLGKLNVNAIEQDIRESAQNLSEEIKPYSNLNTVSLFQCENDCSEIHDTEIGKTVDNTGNQTTEITNDDLDKLLDDKKQYKESCHPDTNNDVIEQAYLAGDNTLTGVKMEVNNGTLSNKDKTSENKPDECTSNNLIDSKRTHHTIFENFQHLLRPSADNLQVSSNIGISNEIHVYDVKESNTIPEVCQNDLDMEVNESELNLSANDCKKKSITENLCPIPDVNPSYSLEGNHNENISVIAQSHKVEKLGQTVTVPVVESFLETLVDFASSDNSERCQNDEVPSIFEKDKSVSKNNSEIFIDFSAQECEDVNAGVGKTNKIGEDITDLNCMSLKATKESIDVVTIKDNGYKTEPLPNDLQIKNSTISSEHAAKDNSSTVIHNYCKTSMLEMPHYSALSDIDRVVLSKSSDICKKDTDVYVYDGNANASYTFGSNNHGTNNSVIVDMGNDDRINKFVTDNTKEIESELTGNGNVSVNGKNVPILHNVNDNEPNIDDSSDGNKSDMINNLNAGKQLIQSSNDDILTSASLNKKAESKNDLSDLVDSKDHEEDVVSNTNISYVDQTKKVELEKEQTKFCPLSKIVEGKPYRKQVKERDGYFLCDVTGCQFKTQYKNNVGAHFRQVHLAIKKHKCDQCTYATPNKSSLKHHMQLNHLNEKKFKCPDCDYLSLFHSDIVKHVRHTHMKQKQYACNQCEYRTGHSHSLKLHIMSHNGIRPYKCSSCEYRANNANKVTRHIKLCHTNEEFVSCIKEDLTFEIDAKQFQCEEIIAYHDIKVLELSAEEADVVMKQKVVKKEQEKEAKVLEKKVKEAEKKAKKEMKRKEEEIANMSALNAIGKFSNANNISTKDIKVIKLTPDTARAFIEAKVAENSTVYTDGQGEAKRFTKILQKPKPIVHQDTFPTGTLLIPRQVADLNEKIS